MVKEACKRVRYCSTKKGISELACNVYVLILSSSIAQSLFYLFCRTVITISKISV